MGLGLLFYLNQFLQSYSNNIGILPILNYLVYREGPIGIPICNLPINKSSRVTYLPFNHIDTKFTQVVVAVAIDLGYIIIVIMTRS